ncbi:hypothetical protein P3T37_001598 [Kitasatospora sp. MAA4]|uniref:hypothetical protein n=1 Tax=Kitasatospora sp. MAA4 TaxID=3035093 RepID=UPI0024771C17|nr:hypothetical protein [Kitasatospora sp. MAA4]MDH6132213.1 hypothetical protein [Kitasatospora sp. MAA4]
MRRDTKIIAGLLALALSVAAAIVWHSIQHAGPTPSRDTWALPADPCQVLTVDELNLVTEIPADSYYRKLPIVTRPDSLTSYGFGNIDIKYQTDPTSCQFDQSTSETAAKPPPTYQDTQWEAEWQYGYVTAEAWNHGKQSELASGGCSSVDVLAGAQDALWCQRDGLFLLRGGMMFGFRVEKDFHAPNDGSTTETDSEDDAKSMAVKALDRIASGSFPAPPAAVGPAYGSNVLIGTTSEGDPATVPTAAPGVAPVAACSPAQQPSSGAPNVPVPQDLTLPKGVTLPPSWQVYGVSVQAAANRGAGPGVVYLAGPPARCVTEVSGTGSAVIHTGDTVVGIGDPSGNDVQSVVVADLAGPPSSERTADAVCGIQDPAVQASVVQRLGLAPCPPAGATAAGGRLTLDTGNPDVILTVSSSTRPGDQNFTDVNYTLRGYVVDPAQRIVDEQWIACDPWAQNVVASCQATFALFLLKGSRIGTLLDAGRSAAVLAALSGFLTAQLPPGSH